MLLIVTLWLTCGFVDPNFANKLSQTSQKVKLERMQLNTSLWVEHKQNVGSAYKLRALLSNLLLAKSLYQVASLSLNHGKPEIHSTFLFITRNNYSKIILKIHKFLLALLYDYL